MGDPDEPAVLPLPCDCGGRGARGSAAEVSAGALHHCHVPAARAVVDARRDWWKDTGDGAQGAVVQVRGRSRVRGNWGRGGYREGGTGQGVLGKGQG